MSATWKAGQTFGAKYRLLRCVGIGGMCEVWAAKNEMTGALVALKLLGRTATSTADAIARFRHEAMVGAQLDHRNIARVYDFLEEPDGSMALVMALLRGKPLATYLKESTQLSERETIAVCSSVLAALEHAHACGILHRDIKPGNVFLSVDPDGVVTPKLLDFGIAKLPTGGVHTRDGTFLGTPQYMAPERVRDAGPINERSDLFSVGVLLYELLTGTSPFERGSAHAALLAVVEDELDPDPLIPPMLWQTVRRLVAKAASDRPSSAAEVQAMLRSGTTETDLTIRWRPQEVAPFTLVEPVGMTEREPAQAGAADPRADLTYVDEALPATKRRSPLVAVGIAFAVAGVVGSVVFAGQTISSSDNDAPKMERSVRHWEPTTALPQLRRVETDVAPASSGANTTKPAPHPVGGKPDF